MPFFKQPTQKHSKVRPVDTQRAKALATALAKRRLITRRLSLPTWAKALACLSLQVDSERLETVLNWYLEHLGGKYVPQAYSAKGFADKFVAIEAAMERGASARIVISDEARAINRNWSMLVWPGDEGNRQLEFVQASLDNWREFLQRVKTLRKKLLAKNKPTTKGRIESKGLVIPRQLETLQQWACMPAELVENWLQETNEIAWQANQWQGNLLKHALHPTHPRIERRLRKYLEDYSGDPNCWYKLRKELNYADHDQSRKPTTA